jgi:CRISPR type IV-associated protein Csf3
MSCLKFFQMQKTLHKMSAPFKKLRVRAYLQSGVISDQYLPLDSVLYYHMVRRKMGVEDISKPMESSIRECQSITLPIKKAGPKSDAWFYHCSFAQWSSDVIEDSSFKVKSGDWLRHSDFLDDKTKKVDIQRGKFKAYHIKMYYRHATYIEWYCTAWHEELCELLKFSTTIGKNGGDGWGSVLKWVVDEVDEDWAIRNDKNKLMRAVPVVESSVTYGVRPSYWNPRHIFMCRMPD